MRVLWLLFAVAACSGESPTVSDANAASDAQPDAATPSRFVAYVSGGADIAWYDVDKTSGALTPISSIAAFRTGANFLAFRGIGHLYAVTSGNRVGAYSIDATTGALTFINDVGTGGTGPAHVSVDRTGKYVFVANYGSGDVSVMPFQPNGGLAAATQTDASGANAHQILTNASGNYVFVPCLGDDKVAQYRFDTASGVLTANGQLDTANGAGPRHLAFSPHGKYAYLINEQNSTLYALAYDTTTGRLSELQPPLSTRATGATGTNTTAEVVVHPSGAFVYGSNRGDDNIAVFAIDQTTGKLTLVDHTSTQGMTPRNFTIDPTGTLLYAANQNSGTVVPFAINPTTGKLTPTAAPITVPTPQFVGILALPL